MKLNARPWIIPDESLSSYVYRFSFANAHASGNVYARSLGMTLSNLNNNVFTEEALERLTELTDYPFHELRAHSAAHFGEASGEEHLLKHGMRFCVLCLMEKQYYRSSWIYEWNTVCSKHGVMLADRCQGCGRATTLHPIMINACLTCGRELTRTTFREADSLVLQSQEFMFQKLYCKQEDAIGDLDLRQYLKLAGASFYLLEGLSSFTGEGIIRYFNNRKGSGRGLMKIAHSYANVYWMYQDFPSRFYAVLDKFSEKRAAQVRYQQKVSFEEILFADSAFETVKDAYVGYWTSQFDRGRIRKNNSIFKSDPALLSQANFEAKDTLKRQYQTSYKVIERLVNRLSVSGNTTMRATTSRMQIDKQQFARVMGDRQWFVTRSAASKMLGISRPSLSALIDAGLLKTDRSFHDNGMLDRRDVIPLLERCAGTKVADPSGLMRLGYALNKYSVCRLTFTDVIRFTLSGELHAYHTDLARGFGAVYFKPSEIERCVETVKRDFEEEQGYSLSAVLRMIGIGERAMVEFMSRGILVPDRTVVQKDGRKHYLFSKIKVHGFVSRYCTITEAAERFGIPASKLRKWVRDGTITDIAQGLCKSYLLDSEEIGQKLQNPIS